MITEHSKYVACRDCAGTGEIVAYRNVADGPMQTAVWACVECNGTGMVLIGTTVSVRA